ncbi:MAG: hypothetical protein AB3N14_15805 [Flavobacteriaceae bacterium]
MKTSNLLFGLCLIFTLISCSQDDENGDGNGSNPLVGTWSLVRVFDLLPDGSVGSEENYEQCDQPTVLIVVENGDISGNGNCFEDGISYQGNWSRVSPGVYQIDILEIPQDGDSKTLFGGQHEVNFTGRDIMQWCFEEQSSEIIYFEFRKQLVF